MSATSSLILIGYRATGKTSVARIVAERLDLPWYDSDVLVTKAAQKSIADIFAQEGEEAFRDIEENVIASMLNSPCVLATGGGAILRAATRQRLRAAGVVVWLTATPDTILARITGDPNSATTRPPLTSLAARDEIETLLKKRNPLYAETAHTTITTDEKSLDDVAEEVWSVTSG
ncbi:MAG: shikimate kinase [Thermoguttaceae bacterium]